MQNIGTRREADTEFPGGEAVESHSDPYIEGRGVGTEFQGPVYKSPITGPTPCGTTDHLGLGPTGEHLRIRDWIEEELRWNPACCTNGYRERLRVR